MDVETEEDDADGAEELIHNKTEALQAALFSASADQALEEAATNFVVPRKRKTFLIEDVNESMEIDELDDSGEANAADGPQVTQLDVDPVKPRGNAEETSWQPKRRPSKIVETHYASGDPPQTAYVPPVTGIPDTGVLAPRAPSPDRKNGIIESDDEELPSLPFTLPRAPSPKKTGARATPSSREWRSRARRAIHSS